MQTQKISIHNKSGLHVRPAGVLVKECSKFKSEIFVRFNNNTYNAKSILSVLSSKVKNGDEIEVECNGPDESEAMAAVINLIEAGLGEV